MTSTVARPRPRGWRWLRRLAIGLVAVVVLLIVGGWLRGQPQWGPFRGQLVDAETGAPIPSAHVMVRWDRRLPTPTGDGGQSFLDAVETVTNDDGRFELAARPRYWELFATRPSVGMFAPGYVASGREVTPPDGVPFVEPTVIKMRPLETRQEQCRHPGIPLHDKTPLFEAAVVAYIRGLDC
jgi:hypothetical protein